MPTPDAIDDRLRQLQARGWQRPPVFGREELLDGIIDHRMAVIRHTLPAPAEAERRHSWVRRILRRWLR